jgi:hypothetical protein
MERRTTLRRDMLLIFLTLLVAYLYVLPRWADWSQNSRLNLVRALVEQQTTSIDSFVTNTGDYALYNGRTYTDKPPGLSFVALPFYAAALPIIDHPRIQPLLAKAAGGGALSGTLNQSGTGINNDKIRHFVAQALLTAITVAFPAALLGVLLYAALGRLGFGRSIRLLITFAYGLATPAAAYANNFYSHQFVAVLLFGAFFLLLLAKEPTTNARFPALAARASLGWVRAFLFGLLCSYVIISEYPPALIIGAFGLWALVRLRPADLVTATIGGLPPLVLMGFYNFAAFGTIWPVGYTHSALWQDQHHTGFMSITYPQLDALWGLTFGSFRGLFIRAPWLLLAIPGFIIWWRNPIQRGLIAICMAAVVLLTLFYSSSVMWWGGYGIGPRYLVPMLPFLAIPTAFAVRFLWKHTAGKIAVAILVTLSTVLTWFETLAGQSFPSDASRSPWSEIVLPAWQTGNIARNFGTALGLDGALSIVPLVGFLTLLIISTVLVERRLHSNDQAVKKQSSIRTV